SWSSQRWGGSRGAGPARERARPSPSPAREADGGTPVSRAPRCQRSHCRPPGQETGIAVGLTVVLITADGEVVEHPRYSRKAERALRKAQRRVAPRHRGGKPRGKAVQHLKRKPPKSHRPHRRA